MLRTRPKWPNATECCGREIQTTRLGRKRAWWAQGTAIEKFEQDIQPEIEAILRNVDIKDADIYFRIYMIGKNEEASRPTIMVCCADVSIGRRAKESLRDSSIIRNNAEFALGSIDFPLEQLVPVRGLAFETQANSLNAVLEAGSDSAPEIQVFATSQIATIGRRLFVTHPWTMDISRHSTGGVVIKAHGQFFQLTVGHITDLQDCAQQSSSMDPDACSFDGQSDSEGGDDLSIFEQDMRRASMSLFDLSDSESSGDETERTTSNTLNCRSPACTDCMTTNSDATGCFRHGPNESFKPPSLIRVGRITLHSKEGGKPGLDYALVAIQTPQGDDPINEINLDPRSGPKVLRIHDIADVGREERRVIVITGSSGVLKGTLIPGITFLGRANQYQPQKLHVVQLDGVVAEGDSGAAVLDEASGNLYGHMVSGCPGTKIAYIVAATEVFEALEARLSEKVSIVSPRKIQKSPLHSSNPIRQTRDLMEHRGRDVHNREESLHPTDSASTSHPIQTNGVIEHDLLQEGGSIARTGFLHSSFGSIDKASDPVFSGPIKPDSAPGGPASLVVHGWQLGGKIIAPHQDEPDGTTHDPTRGIEASSALKIDDLDEIRGGKVRASKLIKKVRRRKNLRGWRGKTRDEAGLERSGWDEKKHQQTRGSIANRGGRKRVRSSSPDTRSKFSARYELAENIPYIDYLGSDFEDESLAHYFMTKGGTETRSFHQAELVDSFCRQRTLQDLKSLSSILPSRNIGLIDDRTNDGTNSVSLGDYGPLSVQKLYLKLKEKRFHAREASPPLNADRRLIFITDLDEYGVTALMATASASQAHVLGDTLYKYIDFQPYIGSHIEPRGFPFFSLSFHLPFYAWRSMPHLKCPQDNRLDRDGNPMRTITDISFLGGGVTPQSSVNKVDYLCEVQMSVLVTGMDDCHWTGYFLIDTYFEHEENKGCVDAYYHCSGQSGNISVDPFTEGSLEADCPILNPWEYFLAVLDCRAKALSEEWCMLVRMLRRRVEKSIESGSLALVDCSTSLTCDDLKEALSRVSKTRKVLRNLSKCGRATVVNGIDFEPGEQFQTVTGRKYTASIRETFRDIRHYMDDLDALCVACEDYAKDLDFFISCQRGQDANLQAKNSQTIVYFLLHIIFPSILAAAILSMNEKAIPGFLGPSQSSFGILAIVLWILSFVLIMLIQQWNRILASVVTSLQKGWVSSMRESDNLGGNGDIELGSWGRFGV
ncbi:hypothetical protein NM208_g4330 [Fusarium decemcellulare]|uniref:Uncharacterized protein n=1 Tax=Fusarium decemcellulare TaxID=57161 RepID=A0ACC1SL16_9HYPO|nr:hypothetical protein NM208_g4330 [Fusarium decemcellulare]